MANQHQPWTFTDLRSGVAILPPAETGGKLVAIHMDPVDSLWFQMARLYGHVPVRDMLTPFGSLGGTLAASMENTAFVNWPEFLNYHFGLEAEQLHQNAELVDRLKTATLILGIADDTILQTPEWEQRKQLEVQMGGGYKDAYVSSPVIPDELVREAEMVYERFATAMGMDTEAFFAMRHMLPTVGRFQAGNWYAKSQWPWALTPEAFDNLLTIKIREHGMVPPR